jgi:hypothetical protein
MWFIELTTQSEANRRSTSPGRVAPGVEWNSAAEADLGLGGAQGEAWTGALHGSDGPFEARCSLEGCASS